MSNSNFVAVYRLSGSILEIDIQIQTKSSGELLWLESVLDTHAALMVP